MKITGLCENLMMGFLITGFPTVTRVALGMVKIVLDGGEDPAESH